MKISLIYPLLSRKRSLIDENKQFWPPLGLAYLAAVLESAGHDIDIMDRDVVLRKNGLDFDKVDSHVLEKIAKTGTALVGMSVTTPNMPDVIHLSRLIRNNFKDVKIVLGGPHVTGESVLTLKEVPECDIAVRGEGESTVLDIAGGRDPKEIKGITYRDKDNIISNPDREIISDIDDLPLPARHLLDMKFYTRPSRFTSRNLNLRTTSIFTARGCPYRCNFCSGPLAFSGKVRFHSPGRVIKEMEELIANYGVEALYFAEDMFLSSRQRAEEILGLFIESGINRKVRWMAQAKANIVTPELLDLMKTAGCVGIEYGFESGSQRILDLMNKRLKVEDSVKAAALTRRAVLRFQANIIVGYPGERREDFQKTVEFIKKIKPNMVGFNLFMPLPGTPSYEALKAENKRIPRWEDIGDPEAAQENYADMPREEFEKLYLEARLKVILPLNLRAFIIDNINNPFRLIRTALTQFKGVLVKTARSISKLRSLKKGSAPVKVKVLFLSYNGLLEPILPSQAVPYLEGLSKRGYDFILFTYEKKKDLERIGKEGIRRLRGDLMSHGIEWRYARYHKTPPVISTLVDILFGSVRALYMIIRKKVRIVHVRGITPGMMILGLSWISKAKILFDMRGLLAEEYAGGGLWKEDSPAFKVVKASEKKMLEKADAVTVLTKKHLELNKNLNLFNGGDRFMDVVPCCVDMERFYYDAEMASAFRRELGLENKFVLMYPGKLGTFYLVDEMLDFYKSVMKTIPNSVFYILTNDETGYIFKKANAAGIANDRLKAKTGVRFEDMPLYMRIPDAGIFFINPYKKIGSSPIKLGEFLSSGVPVIINPGVGDTEEIVHVNKVGVVVNAFNETEYTAAIRSLMELKAEGDALKARCRDTAKKYLSLEEGVAKYSRIYETLLNKR